MERLFHEAAAHSRVAVAHRNKCAFTFSISSTDYSAIQAGANLDAATRPRSSTKGPLDADDIPPSSSPLSPQQPPPRMAPPSFNPRSPVATSPLTRSAAGSPAPGRRPTTRPGPSPVPGGPHKDFSFLLRPEIYHPLPPSNIPAPFLLNQPAPDTPIDALVAGGHFRAAAIAATNALTSADIDPTDHVRIFGLLYTRLACLTLIDATALAAQEVKALEDLGSAFYLDEVTGEHLVPWELRVFNVRLQALGFADHRREVMSYFELAREGRLRLADAMARHDNSAKEMWRERIVDLGVRVAGALVEMDDVAAAAEHLASMPGEKLGMAKALLLLQMGDVDKARRCVSGEKDGEVVGRVVAALADMAEGEYGAALAKWEELKEMDLNDEMVGVNMAVCLLYVGRMQEGKVLLEDLVAAGRSSHTLLFNLTTMYELCTEKARTLKLQLAETVAARSGETLGGSEKTNADFKL
ncbi:tetratricopeptide repeat protein 15 [Echria macrotheca]|uniref:Tetratricopeptide repeat protein 15 n=1 Tax=Echria macrotheca TaxID=438768 RepID=A0AAJ0F6B5_9PEZI|nr:tetratricopeptide repeat protein 15 [Echria macrotheca]